MDAYIENLCIQSRELESYRRGAENFYDAVYPYIPDFLAYQLRHDLVTVSERIRDLGQKITALRKEQTEQMRKDQAREHLEN